MATGRCLATMLLVVHISDTSHDPLLSVKIQSGVKARCTRASAVCDITSGKQAAPHLPLLHHQATCCHVDSGIGNGARVAAVVGTKCRGTIAGFALLSYPLEVTLLALQQCLLAQPF